MGVTKEIIKAGNGPSPRVGDTVTMHYTGTLKATGAKFDSSRDRGTPFTCKIGVGQIFKPLLIY